MRKWMILIAAALLLACMLVPSVRFTEDNDTVLLAKVIYAQCKNEDYSAKLALGREVMRRVDDPWYPATLGEVLREQQQFPAGTRYDSESLRAAHAVYLGRARLARRYQRQRVYAAVLHRRGKHRYALHARDGRGDYVH